MTALLEADPGLPGRFKKTVLLPGVAPGDAARHFRRELRTRFGGTLPARSEATMDHLLLHYFTQRRDLRGRGYRNIEESVTLAMEVDAAAMQRLTHEAEAAAAAATAAEAGGADHPPPRALVDRLFMERLRAWSTPAGGSSSGGVGSARTYAAADVDAACKKMLKQAARDAGDASAFSASEKQKQQRDGRGGAEERGAFAFAADSSSAPPPAPLLTTQQVQQKAAPAPAPAVATAGTAAGAIPSPLLAALGAGLGASLEGLRDADAAAYLDLLEGRRPELRARGLAQLQATHAALAATGAAPPLSAPGDLEDMLDAFIAESRARLQVRERNGDLEQANADGVNLSAHSVSAQELTGAFDAATAAMRRRRAAVSAGSDEALALDVDLRRTCLTLTRDVSRVVRRRCGICGQDDAPGSGCAYGGRSPAPREEVTCVWDVVGASTRDPLQRYLPASPAPPCSEHVTHRTTHTFGQF